MAAEYAPKPLPENPSRTPIPSGPLPTLDVYGEYDSVVLLRNPKSRRAALGREVETVLNYGLRQQGIGLRDVLPTEKELDRTITSLNDNVGPQDILAIWAGDGGCSQVLRAAHRLELPNPIWLLPGGNANDMSRSLGVPRRPHNLPQNFRDSRVGQLTPLEIRLSTGDQEPITQHAFGYWSVGASAQAAHVWNNPAYRSRWEHAIPYGIGTRVAESAVALRSLMSAKNLQPIFTHDAERAIEITVVNGGRIGKHFRPQVDILSPEARTVVMRNRLHALYAMAHLLTARQFGTAIGPADHVSFSVDVGETAYRQIDGEATPFSGQLLVEVKPSDHSVPVLTTRQPHSRTHS